MTNDKLMERLRELSDTMVLEEDRDTLLEAAAELARLSAPTDDKLLGRLRSAPVYVAPDGKRYQDISDEDVDAVIAELERLRGGKVTETMVERFLPYVPQFFCEHVGGLGPDFSLCKTCQEKAMNKARELLEYVLGAK